VGIGLGRGVGARVGTVVGSSVGTGTGRDVGNGDGNKVTVGEDVGRRVGFSVGNEVGCAVGTGVGRSVVVGVEVGWYTTLAQFDTQAQSPVPCIEKPVPLPTARPDFTKGWEGPSAAHEPELYHSCPTQSGVHVADIEFGPDCQAVILHDCHPPHDGREHDEAPDEETFPSVHSMHVAEETAPIDEG